MGGHLCDCCGVYTGRVRACAGSRSGEEHEGGQGRGGAEQAEWSGGGVETKRGILEGGSNGSNGSWRWCALAGCCAASRRRVLELACALPPAYVLRTPVAARRWR